MHRSCTRDPCMRFPHKPWPPCARSGPRVAAGPAGRLHRAARSEGARPNSLRGLRPVRSNSGRESEVEARCARRPRCCAARRDPRWGHCRRRAATASSVRRARATLGAEPVHVSRNLALGGSASDPQRVSRLVCFRDGSPISISPPSLASQRAITSVSRHPDSMDPAVRDDYCATAAMKGLPFLIFETAQMTAN
jgi:hypothetical protein